MTTLPLPFLVALRNPFAGAVAVFLAFGLSAAMGDTVYIRAAIVGNADSPQDIVALPSDNSVTQVTIEGTIALWQTDAAPTANLPNSVVLNLDSAYVMQLGSAPPPVIPFVTDVRCVRTPQ